MAQAVIRHRGQKHSRRGLRRVHLHLLSELLSIFAPWTLGAALLISFTASAGQTTRVIDPGFRISVMTEGQRMTLLPPHTSALAFATPEGEPDPGDAPISDWRRVLTHIRKVDLSRENSGSGLPGTPVLFMRDQVVLPPRAIDPALTIARASSLLLAHLQRVEEEPNTLRPRNLRDLALSNPDGATPGVSRAVARASATPGTPEPEIVASAAMRVPAFAHVHRDENGHATETARLTVGRGYIDLIDPESVKREQKCLAEAIYFEARSEPETGQAAVAQVVLNRVKSGLYPTSICGVVYQNRHRYRACQFTFACEGKSLAITEPGPWTAAQRIAKQVLAGETYNPSVGTSTHYHAEYVAPYWSRRLKRTEQIGRHIFYRLRPGQT